MSETRKFHIGDLLSVTDGRLLGPDSIVGLVRMLDYLTGDGLMTHQLGLAADAVKPDILAQHPWLKDVNVPRPADKADLIAWLSWATQEYGEMHALAPCPASWGQHDPVQDFANEYPNTEIIGPVVLPPAVD